MYLSADFSQYSTNYISTYILQNTRCLKPSSGYVGTLSQISKTCTDELDIGIIGLEIHMCRPGGWHTDISVRSHN